MRQQTLEKAGLQPSAPGATPAKEKRPTWAQVSTPKADKKAYATLQEFDGFTAENVQPAVAPGTFGARDTKVA